MVDADTSWNPAFLKLLREAADDDEGKKAVDEMMSAIRSSRTRKKPPRL